jgi:putative acetyltransferase
MLPPTQEPIQLSPPVSVAPMTTPAEARAFKELNEEWIRRLFTLEEADRRILDDPAGTIVAAGGQVLIATAGAEIVGCVALVPAGDDVYELSKMTVAPTARGRGVGRTLIAEAIGYAQEAGARTLFLGSSTKLANAVRLYESVGFQHVPLDQIGPMPYRRADVFMQYVIRPR